MTTIDGAGEAAALLDDAADQELVLRSRSGDRAAFGELWRRHYRAGISVARSMTASLDADDLVQEAFARIYQSILRGGGPTGSFRAYLFASIRNTAAGWGRARKETTNDDLETIEDPATSDRATEDALDRSITVRAFRSLPSRWQEALWYSEIEGMKPAEVAPLLGMKPTAVAQLTFRAREGLREAWIQAHLQNVASGSSCQWTIERLGAFARSNLSRRDRAKAEGHLAECTRCSIVASEAKDVSRRLTLVLLPLTVGVTGTTAYLATVQGGGSALAALAAMPSGVVDGALAAHGGTSLVIAGGGLGATGSGVAAGGAAGVAGSGVATAGAAGAAGAGVATAGAAGAAGAGVATAGAAGAASAGVATAGAAGAAGAGVATAGAAGAAGAGVATAGAAGAAGAGVATAGAAGAAGASAAGAVAASTAAATAGAAVTAAAVSAAGGGLLSTVSGMIGLVVAGAALVGSAASGVTLPAAVAAPPAATTQATTELLSTGDDREETDADAASPDDVTDATDPSDPVTPEDAAPIEATGPSISEEAVDDGTSASAVDGSDAASAVEGSDAASAVEGSEVASAVEGSEVASAVEGSEVAGANPAADATEAGASTGSTDGTGPGTTDGSGPGTADGSGPATADGVATGSANGTGPGTADGSADDRAATGPGGSGDAHGMGSAPEAPALPTSVPAFSATSSAADRGGLTVDLAINGAPGVTVEVLINGSVKDRVALDASGAGSATLRLTRGLLVGDARLQLRYASGTLVGPVIQVPVSELAAAAG